MPNCPKCGTEVDVGQKTCMWCGEALSGAPTPVAAPSKPVPAAAAQPRSSSPSSQMVVNSGAGIPTSEDARSLAKRGDLEGALMLFHRILEAHPNDQEGLFGIGGVYFKRGDFKKAAESWFRLKALNPSYPNIEGWLAKVQEKLPSSQNIASPPASESYAAAPPRPSRPPSSQRITPPSREEDEDWRRQSVRVGSDIDLDKLVVEPPVKAQEPEKREPDEMLDDISKWMGGTVPAWVAPAGWGLVLLYAAVVVMVYF